MNPDNYADLAEAAIAATDTIRGLINFGLFENALMRAESAVGDISDGCKHIAEHGGVCDRHIASLRDARDRLSVTRDRLWDHCNQEASWMIEQDSLRHVRAKLQDSLDGEPDDE